MKKKIIGIFLAILILMGLIFFVFTKTYITITIESPNRNQETFLVRAFVGQENTPYSFTSIKAGESYKLELRAGEIFNFESMTLLIGHPLYKMNKVEIVKNPYIFRWQNLQITPICFCLKKAYKSGGVPLIDIANHVEYIVDIHIPNVGLEIVAKDTYKYQKELILLPASARWKLGETVRWEKRKIDELRKEMKSNHNKMSSQLSMSYGKLQF